MARYKPKSSQAKALLNVLEAEKVTDGKGWVLTKGNSAGPANRIPALLLGPDGESLHEITVHPMKREAMEAQDDILSAIDAVVTRDPEWAGSVPPDDVYRAALAMMAEALLPTAPA